MSNLMIVIISYLVINLLGSIYELIRDREKFRLHMEEHLERFDDKSYFKAGYAIGMIPVVLIETLIWAPMNLVLSFRRRGE